MRGQPGKLGDKQARASRLRYAAVAIAVLITASLLYLTTRDDRDERNSRTGAAGAAGGPVQPGTVFEESPQLALAGLSWRDYHGIRLPYSAGDGPRQVRAERAAGFSQTPGGALLAAVHIVVRVTTQWGPEVFEPTINQQVVGPDRTALLDSTSKAYERLRQRAHVGYGQPLGRAYSVVEGFRWQGYTPQSASLDLLSAGPGEDDIAVRAITRVQLHWRAGDWRVVAPPGGDWANSAAPASSADGFTLFLVRR